MATKESDPKSIMYDIISLQHQQMVRDGHLQSLRSGNFDVMRPGTSVILSKKELDERGRAYLARPALTGAFVAVVNPDVGLVAVERDTLVDSQHQEPRYRIRRYTDEHVNADGTNFSAVLERTQNPRQLYRSMIRDEEIYETVMAAYEEAILSFLDLAGTGELPQGTRVLISGCGFLEGNEAGILMAQVANYLGRERPFIRKLGTSDGLISGPGFENAGTWDGSAFTAFPTTE